MPKHQSSIALEPNILCKSPFLWNLIFLRMCRVSIHKLLFCHTAKGGCRWWKKIVVVPVLVLSWISVGYCDPKGCLQWPTSLNRLSNENGVFNPFLLQFGVSLKVGGALWQRAAVCPWCPCKKWQFYGGKRIPTLLWPLHHPIPTPPHITTSPVFPFWLLSCWGESTLVRNLPLDP